MSGRAAALRLLLAAALFSAGACAQEAPPAPDANAKVEVSAIRNPDLKKYRSLVAGLDEFEDQRARYAPNATELRFRFWPRNFGKGDPLANLQLKISGESDSLLVPLDANGTFVVPRNERAYDEDADLVLNRKKGELRAFPYVRTPGLPATVRRLGDHRLECRVIVAVAKKDIGLLLTATINTILLTTDWCSSSKGSWGMDSEYELDGATLREGGRSQELVVRGRSYQIPMHDPSWSNDALIEMRPKHESQIGPASSEGAGD
ncbi:hypothetical protein E4L96_20560 [Massilia arenosa]|uniref:Uncharacterized protein n=1 Tax=Zemynaea arenosa TaxID=2561931 RepID=A0A4Y9RS09_9BURK|nr:hypothetical protein [Massilia arenosa]TFW11682.1 hypothetical protein E4L96_20560 [Massilia arenosa]